MLLLRVEGNKTEGVEIPLGPTDIKVAGFATNAHVEQIFHVEIADDKYLSIKPETGNWVREWRNKPGKTMYISFGDPTP